ncbi:Flagellin C [Campylobacter concisus ATCC 51561]|nr:Flagellin C [Campylobacter concisus ATCC 51561]
MILENLRFSKIFLKIFFVLRNIFATFYEIYSKIHLKTIKKELI